MNNDIPPSELLASGGGLLVEWEPAHVSSSAEVVMFLLPDRSLFVTGANYQVDGAYSAV